MVTIDKIYDNTKDGIPNYSIDTIDGKRLYTRGVPLYPVPKSGDIIKYNIINTKTSEKGNSYTNVKDVEIVTGGESSEQKAQQQAQYEQSVPIQSASNGFSKSDTQRLDIFVTGIVGRSMGSGQFSVHDIAELTKNAVSAFNENLKKL